MKIAQLKISNILGIKELEFTPQGFNQISGPNGTGKTSILEAIKSALQSGHDATILRKGESKGESVIVLDDGTEISKSVTPTGSTSSVRVDGKKIARPAEAIRNLADMISVNPVEFLRAPKKDRVRVLLESMPLQIDEAKLSELAEIEVKYPEGTHALHVIQNVHQAVFDNRTGTNRAVKEKKSTITQLEQAVPSVPQGVDGDEESLVTKLAEIDEAREAEKNRIDTKLNSIIAESNARIEEIRAKAQQEIEAIRTSTMENERRANAQRAKKMQEFAEQREPVTVQLSAIRQNRELHARRAQTLETIGVMRDELEALVEEAEGQTKALAAIDAYKSELLSGLPIPGLEVVNGEIYRDGVQFDRLNTAQQVGIAFDIAKLRAGKLNCICLDGLELMDASHFDELKRRAEADGIQLFVTRVSDSDFSIETQ